MNIFGSSSASRTTNNNVGTDAQLDNNQGTVNYGSAQGNITLTDHGAIGKSLDNSAAISQTALLSNNKAIEAALAANSKVSADAFSFGSKSLDLGSYAIESNATFANAALGTVSDTAGGVIESITKFASEILANGATATKGALEFAKDTNRSDSAAQTELMIKAVSVLGIVAVLAFAFGGKK